MGVGIINFVFAVPAFFTIDRFGRRNLLLVTFPFLALFQLFSAIAFITNNTRLVIAGLYLFALAYSPGEGPVPFVSVFPHLLSTCKRQSLLTRYRSTLRRACLCTSAILVCSLLTPLSQNPYSCSISHLRNGSSHLGLMAFLLRHRHHLA